MRQSATVKSDAQFAYVCLPMQCFPLWYEGVSGNMKGNTKPQKSRSELVTQSMQEFVRKEEVAVNANPDYSEGQYSNF